MIIKKRLKILTYKKKIEELKKKKDENLIWIKDLDIINITQRYTLLPLNPCPH